MPVRGAAALAIGAGLAVLGLSGSAVAAADPVPPADPAAPVDGVPAPGPVPAPVPDPVAPQPITAMGPLGFTPGASGFDLLLSQAPAPALPGQQPAVPVMQTDALNSAAFLLPSQYRVPTPEENQVSPYQLPLVTDPGPFARVEGWKGMHALAHDGIGRMPIGELSQPLAGTAPPPGTALPPGPLQNLPPDPSVPEPAPPLPFPLPGS